MPGSASGSLDGIALKPLTVDFHEPALLARLNDENRGADAKLYRGGQLNPQALNRYAYVQNNPVKYTDPSGHTWYMSQDAAVIAAGILRDSASKLRSEQLTPNIIDKVIVGVVGEVTVKWLEQIAGKAVGGTLLRGTAAFVGNVGALATFAATMYDEGLGFTADHLDEIARLIEKANIGGYGVALKYENGALWSVNRSDGSQYTLKLPPLAGTGLPDDLKPGIVRVYGEFKFGQVFASDCGALERQGVARCR